VSRPLQHQVPLGLGQICEGRSERFGLVLSTGLDDELPDWQQGTREARSSDTATRRTHHPDLLRSTISLPRALGRMSTISTRSPS
jgi:hypothetical protein